MLKKITFELTERLCDCPEQNIDWHMQVQDGKHTLLLHCPTCKTRKAVMHENLKAVFALPERKPAARTPLQLIIGGRALD